jgi:hypothetical protein
VPSPCPRPDAPPPAAAPAAAPPPPPAGVFLLLHDDRGRTNAITVTGGGEERLLDKEGTAVTVSRGGVPGEPRPMSDAEVRAMFGDALDALPAPPAKFVLHFLQDSSELAEESRERLDEVVSAVRERASRDVSVVGHADTRGNREHNRRLSLERARAVAALLSARGVDPAILDIASHGKDNPLVPTGDQVAEPRNRRVEVTVR